MAQATSLLKAYNNKSIPRDGALIISSTFEPGSIYSIYEITAIAGVEYVDRSPGGILFNAAARRVHVLVEPAGDERNQVEPAMRGEGRSIPLRFDELVLLSGKRGERIMVSREPQPVPLPFSIPIAAGDNFVFLFYRTDDMNSAVRKFMADVLYNDSGLEKDDAIRAAGILMEAVQKIGLWENSCG